jgi:MFS family permease
MLGSRITAVAYPLLVLAITGSPLTAGWSTFAVIAPSFFVYLPAGVLVDRWDPRRVMFASELGRGAAITSIVIGIVLGNLSLPVLIIAAASEQTLEVFSNLAEQRFSRSLVTSDQATSALVRGETRNHLAILLGRPVGALLFGAGSAFPFVADSFTFLVSLIALFRIENGRPKDRRTISHMMDEMHHKLRTARTIVTSFAFQSEDIKPHQSVAIRFILADTRDGFSWLRSNLFAYGGLFLTAGTTFVSQALIMVFFAEAHSQGIPSTDIGLVLAASGAGGIAGSAAASRLFSRFHYKLLQSQMVVWILTFGFLAFFGGPSYWHIAAAMAVLGFAGAVGNISINTYLALRAEGRLARVLSIDRLTSFLALALGPAFGGALVAQFGTQFTVMVLFYLTVPLGAARPVAKALVRYRPSRPADAAHAEIPAIGPISTGGRDPESSTRPSSQPREAARRLRNPVGAGLREAAVFLPLMVGMPVLLAYQGLRTPRWRWTRFRGRLRLPDQQEQINHSGMGSHAAASPDRVVAR